MVPIAKCALGAAHLLFFFFILGFFPSIKSSLSILLKLGELIFLHIIPVDQFLCVCQIFFFFLEQKKKWRTSFLLPNSIHTFHQSILFTQWIFSFWHSFVLILSSIIEIGTIDLFGDRLQTKWKKKKTIYSLEFIREW